MPDAQPDLRPFASASLTVHLLRGGLAVIAFGAAVLVMSAVPSGPGTALSVALALGGLVVLRGCPVCWLIGLVQLAAERFRQRPPRPSTKTSGTQGPALFRR
jgi:hypothetical protein